jgi:hypothetical protein
MTTVAYWILSAIAGGAGQSVACHPPSEPNPGAIAAPMHLVEIAKALLAILLVHVP